MGVAPANCIGGGARGVYWEDSHAPVGPAWAIGGAPKDAEKGSVGSALEELEYGSWYPPYPGCCICCLSARAFKPVSIRVEATPGTISLAI
jgi:hypothetical protein